MHKFMTKTKYIEYLVRKAVRYLEHGDVMGCSELLNTAQRAVLDNSYSDQGDYERIELEAMRQKP